MNQNLEAAKIFYQNLKFTLNLWGGKKLRAQSLKVFDCFVQKESMSEAKFISSLNRIIKNNYTVVGDIMSEDILGFVIDRYINYLKSQKKEKLTPVKRLQLMAKRAAERI